MISGWWIVPPLFAWWAHALWQRRQVKRLHDELWRLRSEHETLSRRFQRRSDRMDALFATMNEAVLRLDMQGVVVALNDQARRVFHVPKHLPLPQPMTALYRHPEWNKAIHKALSQLPEPYDLPDIRMQERVFAVRLAPLGGEQALLLCLDVSKQRELEAQRERLVRDLMHDLKTPLTSIMGYARARDPDDAAIARSIIGLSHSMKLRVVAEGVETEGQLEFLRTSQCDHIQGYYFSKPLPANEIEQLLEQDRHLDLNANGSANQRTLLIVDDEDNVRASLIRLFRREGYCILTADNAAAAFELLATHQVGVILSDQRMPHMTGTEFFSRVKELYPCTMRIILSAYSDREMVTDAINKGQICKFFTKPWDGDLLLRSIQEAFRRYELESENTRLAEELKQANESLLKVNQNLLARRL